MRVKIAVCRDYIRQKNGEEQSFSARWLELAQQRAIDVVEVRDDAPDLFERIRGCDGFMWRYGFDALSLLRAKRILPAIEHGMAIAVFPSWLSHWHFEDKIAQSYLLDAAGIPTPRTWILWDREAAARFVETAAYPLVAKLASGIQSTNVRLLRTPAEARSLVGEMFGPGVQTLGEPAGTVQRLLRRQVPGLRLLMGKPLPRGVQQGYVYVQEFLPNNAFDTRVTVIGERAFGFRRHNRPNDFRASGSGRIDWNPDEIDPAAIRLAFRVARSLRTQSVAIDCLRRGTDRVVGEISYTYASWAVRDCPGHWTLSGDIDHGHLSWAEGNVRPEDAIFDDFIASLRQATVSPPQRQG